MNTILVINMTEKRFHKAYCCGDTGVIDGLENEWFIENINSISDLEKNWDTVIDKLNQVAEENEKLKKEKEFWKGAACNCSNYLSILSMDCQIVQEAICDLKNVIDVDTEAFRLLDELDDKFDELNQHRIRCMR